MQMFTEEFHWIYASPYWETRFTAPRDTPITNTTFGVFKLAKPSHIRYTNSDNDLTEQINRVVQVIICVCFIFIHINNGN